MLDRDETERTPDPPESGAVVATRFSFVRHGQAMSNQARMICGDRTCTGLTEEGRGQAMRLMRRLRRDNAADPVAAVYSTRLRRARETAEVVADGLDLPVRFLPQLRYPDYGQAEGRPWAEVYAAFPGPHPALNPDLPIAEGAEPWSLFRQSMHAALNTLMQQHSGEHLMVCVSVENLLAVRELAQGLPVDARARSKFEFDHTGITTWDLEPAAWAPAGHRWVLVRHNDTGHLPAEQRLSLSRTDRKLGS
jgi:probable phosphoglycerate mutase